MADYRPGVSVVIVNWNTRELVLQCIRSIYETAEHLDFEIVVVDNASSDGSAEAIRLGFPNVKLIASDRNLGFAAANNKAIEQVSNNYVLILNPDTLVLKDSIRGMRDFLLNNPRIGAVGCRLLNGDGSIQQSFWMEFPSLRWLMAKSVYADGVRWKLLGAKDAPEESPFQVAHLLGACVMTRLPILKALRGFDESYFLYMEETDLCYRIADLGLPVYHLPAVGIVHYGQQSSNQASDWANMQLSLSTYKFMCEHITLGNWARRCLRCTLMVGAIVRIALWTFRYVGRSADTQLARRMLRGYWRLFLAVPGFERRRREGFVRDCSS